MGEPAYVGSGFRRSFHGLPRWEARTARFLRGEIAVPAQLLTDAGLPRCARCGNRTGARGSHKWMVAGVRMVPACAGCAATVRGLEEAVRAGTWVDVGVDGVSGGGGGA